MRRAATRELDLISGTSSHPDVTMDGTTTRSEVTEVELVRFVF